MPVAVRGVHAASVALLAVLMGVVAALGLALLVPARSTPEPPRSQPSLQAAPVSLTPPTWCERLGIAREQLLDEATGSGETVLVLGDSWSTGAKLPAGVRAWPTYLPGRVRVDGVPGSGFSERALGCRGLSFAGRAGAALRATHPGLVVVQGGLNDYDVTRAEVRRGFRLLALALGDREVIVVGPTLAPSRAAAVPAVDRLLSNLCAKAGFAYVPTTDLRLDYLRDGVHLTRKGHRILGEAVAARVAALR